MKRIFRCLSHGKIFLKAGFILKKKPKKNSTRKPWLVTFWPFTAQLLQNLFAKSCFYSAACLRNHQFQTLSTQGIGKKNVCQTCGGLKTVWYIARRIPQEHSRKGNSWKETILSLLGPGDLLLWVLQRGQWADLISWVHCAMIHPILHAFCSRFSLWTAAQIGKNKANVTLVFKKGQEGGHRELRASQLQANPWKDDGVPIFVGDLYPYGWQEGDQEQSAWMH